VHDVPVLDQIAQLCGRHEHHGELLAPVERLTRDAHRVPRKKEMRAGGVPSGLRDERGQQFHARCLEAGLFTELPARRVDRQFIRIDDAGGQLEARAGHAVTILAHERHVTGARAAQHSRPARAVYQVKTLDFVSIGEPHPLLPHGQPALLDQGGFAQDLPGRNGLEIFRDAHGEARV